MEMIDITNQIKKDLKDAKMKNGIVLFIHHIQQPVLRLMKMLIQM